MFPMRALATLLLTCLLASCGGGGGGGSSSSSSSGGGNPSGRGAFTLSATSADFVVVRSGFSGASQNIVMTITGSDVAFAGAAYQAGQTPAPWLSMTMNGGASLYNLGITVSTNLQPGQYSTTFTVGTADASGAVLQQRNFTVNVTVHAQIEIVSNSMTASVIFGDSVSTGPLQLEVTGPARPWSAFTNVPWIQVPAGSFTGNASITATLDVSGLAPGNYAGQIGVRDSADASNQSTRSVTLIVTNPAFTSTQQSLLFGGENGDQALVSLPVNFSLATGAGVHPYVATVTTDSDGGWLQVSNPMGTVGAAGATVNLSVAPGSLRGATRTAQLTLSADVLGRPYSIQVPVTWNREANRLVTSGAGVAFSHRPGRSVLTRTLRVFSPAIYAGTAWTAQSDQPWLTVTPAGTTNGDLVLTADPAGLANETTHFATVTVSSPDAVVENTQTVRVGFWVSALTPVTVVEARASEFVAASPVEPLFAVSGGGSADVHLYDIYSGALMRTFSNVAAQPGALEFSGDGRRLYVNARGEGEVRALDSVTGALLRTFDARYFEAPFPEGRALDVLRPGGEELIITPGGRLYDTATGAYHADTVFSSALGSFIIDHSPDQRMVSDERGAINLFTRTALHGGGLRWDFVRNLGGVSGREACFSPDGTIFHFLGPSRILAFSVSNGQIVRQPLAGNQPSSLRCVWNDVLVASSEFSNSSTPTGNLFNYLGSTGALLGSSHSGPTIGVTQPIRHGIEASGDGTRVIVMYSDTTGATVSDGFTILLLRPPQ